MAELKSFDRVAHCYDDTRGVPADVSRAIGDGLAAIAREAAADPRLLEVGVGTGRMAVPIAEAGVRVTGIDISRKMLDVLRGKRRDIDVMLAEAARPPLRPRSFDALLFVHILHLVPDAEATLRATLPLLRPGGIVIYGGDGGQAPSRAQAEQLIRQAAFELAGVDLTSWDVRDETTALTDRIVGAAAAATRDVVLARWKSHSQGRRMLERLARRDYSSSWRIPEDKLLAIVECVTPQLDELYGGLDREIEFERSFGVTVATLAG